MRIIVTLLLFCGCFNSIFAQTIKFAENSGDFIAQLGEFMNASKRPDLAESYSVFKNHYKNSQFSETDMQQIIAVANRMGELKLLAFPYFKDYLNAISAAKSSADTTLFRQWLPRATQVMAAGVPGRVKPLGQFLEFSVDFMEHQALKTGEGGTVTWKIRGGKTKFEFVDTAKMAVLVADNVRLVGIRKNDSITVYQTAGMYNPANQKWTGMGGRVDWRDSGLDSTVVATLGRYTVEAVKPLFKSDSVSLSYPLYFPGGPVLGRLEHNIEANVRDSSGRYPRFESFAKTLKINKLGEGVEYEGGFKLWGNSVYGFGTVREPAQLRIFNRERKPVFNGLGQSFIIRRETSIVGEGVDAHVLTEENSEISHPGATVRVDLKKQSITLERGLKGSERNPFYSTFYNMNLDAERIAYHYNRDSVEIGAQVTGRKGVEQKVSFESSRLYEESTMIRIQNIAEKNPISSLYLLALEIGKDSLDRYVVTDDDYAKALNTRFDRTNIQTLLAQLVAEGFINYYFDERLIVLRDKLEHYALAHAGKTDFDAIKIVSENNQTNATMNLKTKQTDITNVNRLELSSRQHVAVVPRQQQLTLLKNRDMNLSGRLYAGYALFEGRDMDFRYDQFDIQFDSVRNLDFYIPFGDIDKKIELRPAKAMNSTVEYVSGVLLIDAPNNKSGKENLDMFPSMQSKKNSYVYYQRKEIHNNAYKRDSFFFKLDPFSFDALDSYQAEDLKFKGEMNPAQIFPPFREMIIVRPEDLSFGFIHKLPTNGYSTYAGKGNFKGQVDLSNKGFWGEGTVRYLTADIESEDLLFKPKQMIGTARKFFMAEDRDGDVKTPEARGQEVKVNWLPFRDSMYVESKAKDFGLFKAEGYTHKGLLILTPTGLKGRGVFDWAAGRLSSKLIAYGPFQANSDTADLQIKSITGGSDIVFDSKNVKGSLDFDAQKGYFIANTANANTFLPLAEYRTSMNEFDWDMQAKTITFKADASKPGVFVSTGKERDELRFTGTSALYDMQTNILKIGGVAVIQSADAYIYTKDGNIEIKAGGEMSELTEAKIIADTVNKYHTINRATVTIKGKKDYIAKGYYQYNIPGYEQEIFFDNIVGERVGGGERSKKNVLTSAEGPVEAETNFRMGAKTFFKGKVKLEANRSLLTFEGFGRLDADKMGDSLSWFSINSIADKNNPIVRIKKSRNEAEDPLITGIYLSRETGECYPRILKPAYARVDRPLINAQGVFKYEPETDRFIFGDSAKVAINAKRGAKMIFDNRVGSVVAEGPIGLGSGLEYMKVKAAGRLRTDFNVTDSTYFKVNGEVMTGAQFQLPPKLMDMLVNNLRAATYDAPTAIYTAQATFYQMALPEMVSDPKVDATTEADLKNNLILLPKADNPYAFLLGKHNVMWNNEYQSFLSTEDKIPVITVNGEQLNKVMTAYVEYRMPGNEDDRFYIYLAPTPDLWYFFGYQQGVLNVVSNDTKFTDLLLAMKPKDLQFKMPDGEIYEVVAANENVAKAFVNRVKEGRAGNK
jgi:hypothetical protein